jgi:hypothetical protein
MNHAIGDADEVAWIRTATTVGLNIGAAIPPGFASYATIVIPEDAALCREHDRTLVELLRAHTTGASWWLGYLDTGGKKLPFGDAPMVRLYSDWQYVLVQAGAEEALSWREGECGRTLPDLIFPDDRSWLVSTLWDDDWRCVGGPVDLIDSMVSAATLEVRVVDFWEDATPPGHVAH